MMSPTPNIWVVDDDEGMCSAIQTLLCRSYEVNCFLSLDEVNEAFQHSRPDLLILDIIFRRDETAGLRFLQKLRKSYKFLPVVVCSVRDDWEAGLTAGNLGVTKFVVKDAKPRSFSREMREQVEEALGEAALNAEIASILEDPNFFRKITRKTLEDCDCVVQTAIKCFLRNIRETGPSVEKLAEMTGYCVGTLNSHCKSHFKQTVGDFITYLAVIIGCKIRQKGFSVSQAANSVGMGSERFRQRVQAEFNKAPTAIRESDLP